MDSYYLSIGDLSIGIYEACLVFSIYLLAGFVKSFSGFGFPLVAVPLVSFIFPSHIAVACSLIPIFVSNLFQAFVFRAGRHEIRQAIPLIIGLSVSLIIMSRFLSKFDTGILEFLIGFLIQIFVLLQFFPLRLSAPKKNKSLFMLSMGVLSGGLGGVTSFYGFPAIQSMMSLGLKREAFIFSVSVLFLFGSAILSLAFYYYGIIDISYFLFSTLLIIPTVIGVFMGSSMVKKLPERVFNLILFTIISMSGLSLMIR